MVVMVEDRSSVFSCISVEMVVISANFKVVLHKKNYSDEFNAPLTSNNCKQSNQKCANNNITEELNYYSLVGIWLF